MTVADDPIQCPECGAKPPFVIFNPDYKQSVEQGIRYKRRRCKECDEQWNVAELTTERLDELSTTIEELSDRVRATEEELDRQRVFRMKDARIALTAIQPILESGTLRFKHPLLHDRLRKAADLLIHRNEEDNGL